MGCVVGESGAGLLGVVEVFEDVEREWSSAIDMLVYLIALWGVYRMASQMNLVLILLFFLHLDLPCDKRLQLRRGAWLPKDDYPAMCWSSQAVLSANA
jgi:hypothetical protein